MCTGNILLLGSPKVEKHPMGEGGGGFGVLIIRRVKPPPLVFEVLLQGGRVTLTTKAKLSVVAFKHFFVR